MCASSALQVEPIFFVLAFLCFSNFNVESFSIGDSSSPHLLYLVELVL